MTPDRSMLRRAYAVVPVFAVALLVVHAAKGQMPPGGRVVQISQPFIQTFPAINDLRQVAFTGIISGAVPTARIYLFENDIVTQISDPDYYSISPDLNNNGQIAWARGTSVGGFSRYDIVVYEDGIIENITNTPWQLADEGTVAINDYSEMTWQANTCLPASCSEVFAYDGENIEQLTFGGLPHRSQLPDINDLGQIVWTENDWTFGIDFSLTTRVMRYADGEIQALTPVNDGTASPCLNNLGQIAWSDGKGDGMIPAYLWDDGTTTELFPYGSPLVLNDRGDVLFWTEETDWLYRNGAFYQPFESEGDILSQGMNVRGDVVANGHPFSDIPADIFLMVIDPIPGDYDEDGDVDLDDTAGWEACMDGPAFTADDAACLRTDFDEDQDIDLRDVGMAQNAFTGNCALAITTPPNGEDVCITDPVTLSIEARGPIASYQWRFEGVDIPGATEPTYTIPLTIPCDEGGYGVRLTSECGWEVESDYRHRIKVPWWEPTISEQPDDQTACEGQDIRFCVGASADFVDFQWQQDEVDVPGADWWCLIMRDVTADQAGSYRCLLTNACGTTTSLTATLTIASPDSPPAISQHPRDQSVSQGLQTSLSVTASCADDYQWQQDGVNLRGETLPELFIFPASCDDEGFYTVVVTNDNGSTTSEPAFVNVSGCP